MNSNVLLRLFSVVATVAGVAVTVYVLAATPSTVAPSLGERGRRRRAALEAEGSFARVEPLIRKVSGWIARVSLPTQRARMEELLRSSGYVLGATPDELIAMMILAALGAGLLSILITFATAYSTATWFAIACCLGFVVPYANIAETVKNRRKAVNRGLPPAIDLVSLCIGAGTDFPSALRFVIGEIVNEQDPTREEFAHILQLLEVGHTRAHALTMFAERVPTEAVRDFVGSVVQAEEKGTPLAEVLQIQARMLRMRRSVSAEEAAARAAVMLIGPLMLQLCAILLLLFSPFLINGLGF
jgi:tight adherence protein C